MLWRTLTPPDSVGLALSRGAGGSKWVVVAGWSVVWYGCGVVRECRLVGCVMVEPSFVRGHGRRRARRTTVSQTLWTLFPFRPVHAWLVWCWPACVWSVYGQVAAAAAVLLVRGCPGRLMVGLVCVGSIVLLLVVVPPNVVYAAGMSVSVLVSGVVVCPSVVLCSLLPLVGRVCIGSVAVFCCVCGYGRRWA